MLFIYIKNTFSATSHRWIREIRKYIGGFQTEIRIKIKSGFVMDVVNVIRITKAFHRGISYLHEQLIKSTSKYVEKVAGCSRWPCRFGKHR